jgi:ribosomal protein S18 acetylase RimI-like enzyme
MKGGKILKKYLPAPAYSWYGLVKSGILQNLLLSAAGVGIAYILIDKTTLPSWLVINPYLSLFAFCLSFLCIWNVVVNEDVSASSWDIVADYFTGKENFIDRALEGPFLLICFILPFSALAYQFLIIVLFIYYAIDFIYCLMLYRALPRYYKDKRYTEEEQKNCPYLYYYKQYVYMDFLCMLLVLLSGSGFWIFALKGLTAVSMTIGFISISLFVFLEGIYYFWVLVKTEDTHKAFCDQEVKVLSYGKEIQLSERDLSDLGRSYELGFPPEERVCTVEEMLQLSLKPDCHMSIAKINDRIAGFSFGQICSGEEIAFLWYLCVLPEWRQEGIGARLSGHCVESIGFSRETIRYAFLESRKPDACEGEDSIDIKRLRFHRRQGNWWIKGIDYAIPSAKDSAQSIPYWVLFHSYIPQPVEEEVKRGILAIHRSSAGKREDLRLRMEQSLDHMILIPPPVEKC